MTPNDSKKDNYLKQNMLVYLIKFILSILVRPVC